MFDLGPVEAFILLRFPILVFMNFAPTELIFSPMLWVPISVWRFFGPAELTIAAIVVSMSFIWIVTLPYLSWRIVWTLRKYVENKSNSTAHSGK